MYLPRDYGAENDYKDKVLYGPLILKETNAEYQETAKKKSVHRRNDVYYAFVERKSFVGSAF